jgi:photosystem II stability/assembly factor-like uncharacterized protein
MSCSPSCLDASSRLRNFASLVLVVLFAFSARLAADTPWSVIGPDGGDARSFAAVPGQPDHIYLGTTTSWIYESTDGGGSWHRLAKLDSADGLILDNMVVDAANPALIYVAGWRAGASGGGLWVSRDAGRTWSENAGMKGRSIRAFVQAPSDATILVAGTLQGVFRSNDAGATWKQISPPDSHEIHEVESLAVDPANPDVIYAGTWHLPWKTTDGGEKWQSIKKGLIDDSDVFSIIIDPAKPKTIFLSACSGIYKSESGGELFRKIQGIPSTARRTRVLMQDPEHRDTVYAGTTEGLYKTTNAGRTFERMTGPDVIVNDVYVDPRETKHVLLATDRGGVLASSDAAATFAASNSGFSAREVEALLVDRNNPSRVYAGVANDKEYGGAFVSINGGAAWEHIADGLDGRDVFALAQANDGTLLAGTNSGIFALQTGAASESAKGDPARWEPRNTIANTSRKASIEVVHGKRIDIEKSVKDAVRELDSRVNALDLSGDVWIAGTSEGIFTSRDKGATWQGGPVVGVGDYLSISALGDTIAAARPDGVVLSTDGGLTWLPMRIPAMLTRIHCVTFSASGRVWIGAREGVYYSDDKGKTWWWVERLPFRDIDDLVYDKQLDKVLVSSRASDQVFSLDPKSLNWKWWQTGFRIALIRASGQRLMAASLYDGVLLEPKAASAETSQR